jgi:hypothetical protein
MATKSIVIRVEVDKALRAHNCQANRRHRLERGDTRLKVRNGRSWDHYCAACAVTILERDVAKLRRVLAAIQAHARGGLTSEAVEQQSSAANAQRRVANEHGRGAHDPRREIETGGRSPLSRREHM